jgi:hypothetical protein
MKKRELEALTVVQLRALARERGVRLRARLKSEIVKELAKGSRAPKGTARKTAVAGKKGRAAAGSPKRADASPGGLTRKALRAQTVAGLRATAKSLGVTLRERRKEAIIGEILKQARRAAREKKQPVPSKQRAKAATGTKPGRSGKKSAAGAARGKRKVPSPTRIRPAPEGGPGRGVAAGACTGERRHPEALRRASRPRQCASVSPREAGCPGAGSRLRYHYRHRRGTEGDIRVVAAHA